MKSANTEKKRTKRGAGERAKRPKYRVQAERTTLTYVYCWITAKRALKKATAQEAGSFYERMTAAVFSAFTVEGFLNHLGQQRLRTDWDILERRLGPREKLLLLQRLIPLAVDDGKRPFQTLRDMLKVRDSLAHGKTQTVTTDTVVDDPEDESANYPEAPWSKLCSRSSVTLMVQDAEAIVRDLAKQTGSTRDPFSSTGHGGSMVSRPGEPRWVTRY
jgi:hypothetical protein